MIYEVALTFTTFVAILVLYKMIEQRMIERRINKLKERNLAIRNTLPGRDVTPENEVLRKELFENFEEIRRLERR